MPQVDLTLIVFFVLFSVFMYFVLYVYFIFIALVLINIAKAYSRLMLFTCYIGLACEAKVSYISYFVFLRNLKI